MGRFSALKYLHSRVSFGQIREAKDELESMQAYLKGAERFKDTDETTGLFVQRIRGFAFEIEDVADKFTYKAGGQARRVCYQGDQEDQACQDLASACAQAARYQWQASRG